MKLKKVTFNDPVERLAVSIKRSTLLMLDAYREYYRKTYGEEIEKSQLVESILKEFMQSDRDFVKSQQKPAPVAKSNNETAVARKEGGTSPQSVTDSLF